MSSIVDTSVKHFNSTMSGAPALNTVAGALAALLDAVLRDGFDLKIPNSLTVSGGVATLAFTGSHSAQVDAVILVAGSSVGALNGEQKVTAVGSGVVRFATSAADGTASGAITFKMASLGFTSPFTGTNLRTYKSGDPSSTGMVLRLDDTGTTIARVRGFEAMTDINTGTGPFPTDVQISGGGYWAKGLTASATALPWLVIGDGKAFYFFVAAAAAANASFTSGWVRGFGDMLALRPGGDAYGCVLSCSSSSSVANMFEGCFDNSGTTSQPRMYSPRDFTGLGSSVAQYQQPYTGGTAPVSGADLTLGAFPSNVDGSIKISKKYIYAAATPRLDVPGLYHVPQTFVYDTLKHLDVVPGSLALAGKSLMVLQSGSSNLAVTPTTSNSGALLVDRTGPWR